MEGMFKRWRWALLVAAFLIAGLVFALWPEATPVDVGEVDRGPIALAITDDGVTRAEDYYVVTAPVTGFLDRIELEPGDQVVSGDLITQMRGRPSTPLDRRSLGELRSAQAAAVAAADGVQKSLQQSRRDLERAEELSRRGFLSQAQLEAARTRVALGEDSLAQYRAEATRIRSLLARPQGQAGPAPVPVRAPTSGSVMSVTTESEGVIAEGTPLMTIGDPHRIEVVVDLLSREAVRVSPGDRVEITQWGGPQPLIGTVDRVEPFGRLKISALGIEEQRVNVVIRFDEGSRERASRLGHGFQLDARIILEQHDDALRVPIGAIFRGSDGGWRVFVIEDRHAREQPVTLGIITDDYAQVIKGLAKGAKIVLNPGNALQDGDRVKGR